MNQIFQYLTMIVLLNLMLTFLTNYVQLERNFQANSCVNSLCYKFDHIKDLLIQNTVDLLSIAKTKLGESFVNTQFMVDSYHLWRVDRNQKGGGVAAFIRSDI